MYRVYEKYSTRTGLRRIPQILLYLLKLSIVSFLIYIIITSFFVTSFSIGSVSMKPTLENGDRVLVSSLNYGPFIPFTKVRIKVQNRPQRGDIVIFKPPYIKNYKFPLNILEPIVNFFTLNSRSLLKDAAGHRIYPYMVKRVIGVPGDTVKIKDFLAYIKESGKSVYIRESSLIHGKYHVITDFNPSGWKEGLPFSGNMDPVSLGKNEYILLGDNRPESSDSRSWGIVKFSRIMGKVIYRYEPLSKFGKI
ncbi:MAG: signal peptidase I [Spirochaetes bacterium]|nr:MAG: signal peptidase I [Spirochaetota bacterium]